MIFNMNKGIPHIKVDIVGEVDNLRIVISGVNTIDEWSTDINPKSKLEWNPKQTIKDCVQHARDNFCYYDCGMFVTFTTRFREDFKYLNEINLMYIEKDVPNHSLYDHYHSDMFEKTLTDEFMGSFNRDFFTPPVNPMDKKEG